MSHVLVIDDEISICEVISAILSAEGHAVMAAYHGAEGLRLLQAWPFDLIILDINMPIMDGWQFLAAYQHLPDPRCPVIICTAQRAGFGDTNRPGSVGLFLKPFDVDDLLTIVAQYVTP